jgi:site-specific DNA-methyltransferase (adenine-specific)
MNNGSHSWYSDRKQTSVWKFDKERFEGHTTPKPVGLVEKAITNSSKGGDIIIDLFGGSGSTMIASEKIGRQARIMELDPKYCDVIVKRWEDFTGKKAELL